ncbi:MAG: alpha/beta hydrolase-fold protein [Bacteroidota bacterium]
MRKFKNQIALFLLILPLAVFCQRKDDIVIGKKYKIQSLVLNEIREYWIYLPESYNQSQSKYPVLVLLDGETYFHSATGVIHFLAMNKLIPEMIVVALPNIDRTKDLTPSHSDIGPNNEIMKNILSTSGGGDKFLGFISNELMPIIDKNYRTDSIKTLVGHSFGGLFAINSLLQNNKCFKAYVAIDPPLWWDSSLLINKLKNETDSDKLFGQFLFLTSSKETNIVQQRTSQVNFYTELSTKHYTSLKSQFQTFDDENHASVMLVSLNAGLKYIFNEYNLSDIKSKSISEIKIHYEMLSSKWNTGILPSEELLRLAGNDCLEKHDITKAIDFYKLNVLCHPTSSDTYIDLARAYQIDSNNDQAIKNYKLALQFKPNNKSVKKILKRKISHK